MRAFIILSLAALALAQHERPPAPRSKANHTQLETSPNEAEPKLSLAIYRPHPKSSTRTEIPSVDCNAGSLNLGHGDVYQYVMSDLAYDGGDCWGTFDVAEGVEVVVDCPTFDIGTENVVMFSKNGDELQSFSGDELNGYIVSGFGTGPFELWMDLIVWEDNAAGSIECYVEGQGSASPPPSPSEPPPAPAPSTPPSEDCECGLGNGAIAPSGRIVDGVNAAKNEIPWQVGLNIGGYWCGGTVIAKQWVLTAAHCTAGFKASDITAYLQEHDFQNSDGEITATVSEIKDYPNYDADNSNNGDYSLLKLTNELTYSDKIRPACLPQDTAEDYAGKMAMVSGWGTTSSGGSQPNILQKLDQVTIFTNQQCKDVGYGSQISDLMMCGSALNADGAISGDSCQGDSGGPLVHKKSNGRWEVIGVVSWGYGCATPPHYGVYARVTNVLGWINNIVGQQCNA